MEPIDLRMNWTEANIFCGLEIDALHLDNWLLHRDLSRKFLLQRAPNGQNEFWTAWYVEVRSKELPEIIHRFGSAQNTSIFNPAWASLEPHLANSLPGRWCLSWGAALLDETNFGWHIRNCSDQLSVICQTFACYLDGIGLPQHRCADNGACVSHRALCDGVSDCESGDDEWAQNCDKTNNGTQKCEGTEEIFTELSDSTGDISPIRWRIAATKSKSSECLPNREKWTIEQKPGARIKLEFLALQLSSNDRLSLIDLEKGEHFQISQNDDKTPSILAANRLLILYEQIQKNGEQIEEDEKDKWGRRRRRGFHLHFEVDDANVCVRTFESWNGSFAVPMNVPDTGRYRTPMQCQWTIENRNRGVILVKFPLFRLSPGDWFGFVLLDDAHSVQFAHNFSLSNSAPSLLVTNSPHIQFFFRAINGSLGDAGVRAVFQRTCENGQFIDPTPSGNVLIFLKKSPTQESPINCPLRINVSENEPFSLFVDQFKGTERNNLIFFNIDEQRTNNGRLIGSGQMFRSHSHSVLLNILLNYTSSIEAKIAYSLDCRQPFLWHSVFPQKILPNSILDVHHFPFRYRFPSVPCPVGNKSAELICVDGGKWRAIGCQEEGDENENYGKSVNINNY
ncbi:hypothetical protein niasHT_019513 [Heterodera trifolii]|uniref:Uncharacterized protein n=1 Tax=Heterodera trifolii TaxID=157864 RepID=A0ABD2KVZ9_9BILA